MGYIESRYIDLNHREIGSATLSYNETLITGSFVSYLSNGSGWEQVINGNNFNFPSIGSSLKYKIETSPNISGAITNLNIIY